MMPTEGRSPEPTRRSPLEAAHATRGATPVVPPAPGLAEVGPFDKWSVKGPRAAGALASAGLAAATGEVRTGAADGRPAEAWGLAPDESLVVARPGGGGPDPLAARLEAAGAHVIDVSSAWTAFRLAGPDARLVLEEVCAVDLADASFADGRLVQAPLAGVRVILARRDLGAVPAFTILVGRDLAAYLWDALLHVGARHGLEPVGADGLGRVG